MNKVIKEINKKKKITEYLERKNILPVGNISGNRIKYCCPLHGEKIPSFMVYIDGDRESFYCFGCKNGGGIIQLYKSLEKVSSKQAIEKLSQDLDINLDSEIDDAIEELEESYLKDIYSAIDYALMLSQEVYRFNKATNYKWFDATERICKICDDLLNKNDINNIKKLFFNSKNIFLEKVKRHG